jgi:hypothetical protein
MNYPFVPDIQQYLQARGLGLLISSLLVQRNAASVIWCCSQRSPVDGTIGSVAQLIHPRFTNDSPQSVRDDKSCPEVETDDSTLSRIDVLDHMEPLSSTPCANRTE